MTEEINFEVLPKFKVENYGHALKYLVKSFFCFVSLIHLTDPQSRPVVITIFTPRLSIHPSVSTFQNRSKQNNFQVRVMIATGGIADLAEWIIDDISLAERVWLAILTENRQEVSMHVALNSQDDSF